MARAGINDREGRGGTLKVSQCASNLNDHHTLKSPQNAQADWFTAFTRKTGLKSLLHHNLLGIIIKMNVEAECHPSTLRKHTPRDKVHAGITHTLAGLQGQGAGWGGVLSGSYLASLSGAHPGHWREYYSHIKYFDLLKLRVKEAPAAVQPRMETRAPPGLQGWVWERGAFGLFEFLPQRRKFVGTRVLPGAV